MGIDACIYIYRAIDLISRVFANGPWDRGSIPGQVIPKSQKTVLDAVLLNTQHNKLRIKGKVEQSREWSGTLSYILVLLLLKREPLVHLGLTSLTLLTYVYIYIYIYIYINMCVWACRILISISEAVPESLERPLCLVWREEQRAVPV